MNKFKTLEDIRMAKELISPPGDTLSDTIESYHLTQADMAARMGRPVKTVNEIIKGKTVITPETAIQLERILKIPASFWLKREADYQIQLAEIAEAEKFLEQEDWINKFPLNEMKRNGWIDFENNSISKMKAILSFLGISNIEGFERVYGQKLQECCYRTAQRGNHTNYAIAVWLRRGEIQSEEMKVKTYSSALFKDSLLKIKSVLANQPDDFFNQMQKICAEAGVKVIHTPCVKDVSMHGSTHWVKENPVIQLSNRYKRNDIFWFTFFHEAGHILKHGKKALFVEGPEPINSEKEIEADDVAVEYTLSKRQEAELMKNMPLNNESILMFAKKFNTHPACIIGRFARKYPYLNKIGWSHGYFLKVDIQ